METLVRARSLDIVLMTRDHNPKVYTLLCNLSLYFLGGEMLIAGFVLDGNLPLAVPVCTAIFTDLREIFEKYFVYIF